MGLSYSLRKAGFKVGRLQTGTPARLDAGSIDFERMEKIRGDEDPVPFSFMHQQVDNAVCSSYLVVYEDITDIKVQKRQLLCWMTHTTPETHNFVLDNIHDSVHIQETKNGMLAMFSSGKR